MATPFRLSFKQGHHITHIQDFHETELEWNPSDNVLVENVPLTVLFESGDPEARFYMDGLDTIPAKELKEDMETGDVYLSPSYFPVILYENKTEYYPFIPGFYRIEVVVNSRHFYSWVAIRPKQVDRVAWEFMRDEIEATLSGLAQDFARQTPSFPSTRADIISHEFIRSFVLIKENYLKTLSAIDDIARGPRARIQKQYHFIPVGRSAAIDRVTIRERCRHPEETRRIKVPESMTMYNLQENQQLKLYVATMVQSLNDLIRMGKVYAKEASVHRAWKGKAVATNEQDHDAFKEWVVMAEKLRKALNRLAGSSWMKDVTEAPVVQPSPMLVSDHRYSLMYRLYKGLVPQGTLQPEEGRYQWKRTDKLYEIWGFIKFIKLISGDDLGFKPVKGWLFDSDGFGDKPPDLPSGTRITFKKDKLSIQLVYDQKITRRSVKTDPVDAPLFMTHGHNRPDTRLDYFYENIYIGSLLVDFKYRPRVYLWQDDMIETTCRPKVMAQLIDYGNACRSNFLFTSQERSFVRDINPVLEVWAIYPDQINTGTTAQNDDYRIRVMEMTPGQSIQHVTEEIKTYTERLIQRYEYLNKK